MDNMRKALRIAREIEGEFAYAAIRGSIKWSDIFASEEEIVAALKEVEIPAKNSSFFSMPVPVYSGYEYIHSFARRVQEGKDLTDAQMRQAKRLALEIKKAAAVSICFKKEPLENQISSASLHVVTPNVRSVGPSKKNTPDR